MKTERLKELYQKYNLTKDDVFKHQHYIIITRSGINKIQGIDKIHIEYEVVTNKPEYSSVKAIATKGDITVQTFGSALKGETMRDGNCNNWYVLEMAEKRSMSRAVLLLTGFYELGVYGEDESEDFKRK